MDSRVLFNTTVSNSQWNILHSTSRIVLSVGYKRLLSHTEVTEAAKRDESKEAPPARTCEKEPVANPLLDCNRTWIRQTYQTLSFQGGKVLEKTRMFGKSRTHGGSYATKKIKICASGLTPAEAKLVFDPSLFKKEASQVEGKKELDSS
jgi:hypothetical protein